MKTTKILAIIITALLALSTLFACAPQGNQNNGGGDTAPKPVSVQITNTQNVYMDEIVDNSFLMQVEVKNATDKSVKYQLTQENDYVAVSDSGVVTLQPNTPEWYAFEVTAQSYADTQQSDSITFTVLATRSSMSGQGQIGQIIASVNGNPSTCRGISWFTSADVEESDLVLSTSRDMKDAKLYLGLSNTFTKPATEWDEDFNLGAETYYNHKVTLTDLTPDTTYYYKVGSQKLGLYSDVCSFKTSGGEADSVNVFITTDVHYGSREDASTKYYHAAIADAFTRYGYVDMALDCGDFKSQWKVGTSYYYFEEEWIKSMASMSPLLKTTTFVPVNGNHDNSNPTNYNTDFDYAFFNHYNVPASPAEIDDGQRQGLNYSFDVGAAHLVVFNYSYNGVVATAAQKQWLENDLKSSTKQWKVVFSHAELSADVKAIVEKYGVTLAFNGHEHVYKHSKPMLGDVAQSMNVTSGDSKNFVLNNQVGTTYVTNSTTGGADSWGSKEIAMDNYLCAFQLNTNLGATSSQLALGDLGTVKSGWGMYSVLTISQNSLMVSVFLRNSTSPNTPFTLLHTYGFTISL